MKRRDADQLFHASLRKHSAGVAFTRECPEGIVFVSTDAAADAVDNGGDPMLVGSKYQNWFTIRGLRRCSLDGTRL
jgi:hypothetical protein